MNIRLPEAQQQQLDFLAANAGYESAEGFVQDYLLAMTSSVGQDAPTDWTESELQEFAAACDRGMADARAGRVMSVEEARSRSHQMARSRVANRGQ